MIAAVAVPSWRDHKIADHSKEALSAGDAAKLVVMEAETMRGGLANLHPGDLKYNAASTLGPYVAKVDVSESGRITVTTKDTGASPDPVFLLTPMESSKGTGPTQLVWSCDIVSGDTRYKPDTCTRSADAPSAASTVSIPGHTTSAAQPAVASTSKR